MASVAVACYRPFPGKEEEMLALARDHAYTLRSLGFITDRDAYLMMTRNGILVEVLEWSSEVAKQAAHEDPRVIAMWARFDELSESVPLSSLEEADQVYANFKPL